MGGRYRSARRSLLAALALPLLAGCDTKAELMPLEEARSKPPKAIDDPLIQLAPAAGEALPGTVRPQTVSFDGRVWQAGAAHYRLPATAVRPVATVREVQVYALAWDEPPYDRLLVQADGRWRELLDIY